MLNTPRSLVTIVLMVAILAGAVNVAGYIYAFANLEDGPSPSGWDALAFSNHLAPVVAGLAALAVIVRSFMSGRVLAPSLGLLLASGVTALIAGGLYLLGHTMVAISNDTVLDWSTPSRELDLNSLLLGVQGSGYDLVPVPLVLLVAALIVLAVARVRRALTSPVVD